MENLNLIVPLVILISVVTRADPRTNMVEHFCEKMTEKDASKFPIHNYSGFMDGLKEQLGRDKYVSCTIGPSLKVYVISQCMEDLSDKECRVCFSQIINVLANCFPASSARVYLDGCFMRLENYSFHEESIGSIDVTKCGQDTEPEQVFKELVEEVIKNIVEKAPMDERGFAVFKETRNGISAYGMATCWRNLDKDMCSECLNEAATSTTSCLPSVEGRVLNAGCFLRYSHYQFANNLQFSKNESHAQIWLYITYAISAVIICIMAIGLGFFVGKVTYRKMVFRKTQKESEMDLSALHKSLQFLQFKYSTLERATDSFSESKKLGRGGFGEIFKTWKHFQANTESEIIDKSMKNMEEYRDEIERVVWVGLLCTQESLVRRPTMTSIVQMLKQKDTPLPLPSRPPFMDEWMELMSPSAGLASRRQSLQKSS
ncbi:hypothetical protein Patl1_02794 [Pistacia atlantica]|uniref:Uncharacterized protein n=1 Tax=Pistacia atlantica TaxID=434234 RepID=A0ACC1CBF8_9ROSI|nr:hypothetical protein Patl1_02794 [Pistacia atlantica]